ncbi:unnamed protein product [Phaeothamnion confervicola]
MSTLSDQSEASLSAAGRLHDATPQGQRVDQQHSIANNALALRRISTRDPFHVHFGAGRLGLGLVTPAIARSNTPFAIVQRPQAAWSNIAEHQQDEAGCKVELRVNGESVVGGVAVANQGADVDAFLDELEADKNDADADAAAVSRLLALTDDKAAVARLARRATSFSCSLGPAMRKVLLPLFSQLPVMPEGQRPVLYACENDHEAVRRLAEAVRGRVDCVPCMVDRICTGREIGGAFVDVEAEPGYGGSIVVLKPALAAEPSKVPFAGEGVVLPRTQAEADYFYKRKLSLVNGMVRRNGFGFGTDWL